MKSKFRHRRQTARPGRVSAGKYAAVAGVSTDNNGDEIDRPIYLRLNLPADQSAWLTATGEASPETSLPNAVIASGRGEGKKN